MSPLQKAAKIVGLLFLLPALYVGIGLKLNWLAGLLGWNPLEYNREIFIAEGFVVGCVAEATAAGPDHVDAARFTACLDRWNR